ncbi:hypothetical protein OWR28_14560 [Chryseobacterium sp. 1B4]
MEATSPASGVSVIVPYNGGNGGVYSELIIPSIGVTNLTAVLPSGTLNNGSGTLIFNIVGTPSAAGSATFNINLGGENCGFNIPVQANTTFADVLPIIINGQTRQMMTRNLGADPTMDPDVPNQAIMGSYYQWGRKMQLLRHTRVKQLFRDGTPLILLIRHGTVVRRLFLLRLPMTHVQLGSGYLQEMNGMHLSPRVLLVI